MLASSTDAPMCGIVCSRHELSVPLWQNLFGRLGINLFAPCAVRARPPLCCCSLCCVRVCVDGCAHFSASYTC